MKPVEKGLGRSEGVVESEEVACFRIALGKSEESEVSVLTRIYALAIQKYQEYEKAAELAPDSCITTQIDRGALVLKPQQMRPSPVNEGNLDTGGYPLNQY
jgi:hypothetical protein